MTVLKVKSLKSHFLRRPSEPPVKLNYNRKARPFLAFSENREKCVFHEKSI